MNDIDEIRRNNLRLIEKEARNTSDAAKRLGMSPAQFSNLRDGAKDSKTGRPRGMRKETARRIEAASGKPLGWLDVPHHEEESQNVEATSSIAGRVPVISWVQAGDYTEAIETAHAEEWVDTATPITTRTFALRVKGDSMAPMFHEGVIIVVEPSLEPLPNDFVVARNGGGEATFKQLIRDGEDWYLRPLNQEYKMRPLGSSTIIGVVREMVKKFR